VESVALIITIYNQSGGVMKTSLTMNLGYQMAQHGRKVLLVDMDPQASLTAFMGLEPADLDQTIADSVLNDAPLAIQPDIHQMDLLPSNIMLSAAEMQLTSVMAREWRLRRVLEPIVDQYDVVLIDSPPSLGILSILSLVASTHVLIPIQTQYKSYKGTELLLDSVKQVQEYVNSELRIAGVVPTIYASSNAQDKAILGAIQEQLGAITTVFPPVPRATAFADASMEHLPLARYNPSHPAVKILEAIATQLEALR
jgi:chromosome partitioning protein